MADMKLWWIAGSPEVFLEPSLCLKSNIISVAELNVGLFALAHAII